MKKNEFPESYETRLRFRALKVIKDEPVEDKADLLNLLEDILNPESGRTPDKIVEDFLNHKTPVVYAPLPKTKQRKKNFDRRKAD